MKKEKAALTWLDFRLAVSVLICYGISTLLTRLGISFSVGNYQLEVVQKMTACISCLLCCQDNTAISRTAGINRLIITAIGGVVGIVIVLADLVLGNVWAFGLLLAAAVAVTMFLCKAAGVPLVNCRIGCVTLVLVASTLNGEARIWYAVFRFLSTVVGVLVVLLVTWGFEKIHTPRKQTV